MRPLVDFPNGIFISMRNLEDEFRLGRTNHLASGLMAGLLLTVAIVAVWYGLVVLGGIAKEILVSVVAAAASLLSAVFTYGFQRAKDVELAAIQKRREMELAERKVKQENYARILQNLAPYIRDPNGAADDFTTAYLHTWVTGSDNVVLRVYEFLDKRSDVTLDGLLYAMRADLRLELAPSNLLEGLSSRALFVAPPPPPAKKGLN
jgi:hypothetical protein